MFCALFSDFISIVTVDPARLENILKCKCYLNLKDKKFTLIYIFYFICELFLSFNNEFEKMNLKNKWLMLLYLK